VGRFAFEPVELNLGPGLSCFAELAHALAPSAFCIVLHDEGEDLDSLRWLSTSLFANGISQLLVDLPGHGLSSGGLPAHASAAVTAAYGFARACGYPIVGLLAEGSTCHAMLRVDLQPPPVAGLLLSPRNNSDEALQCPGWIRVPKLVVVPSDSPESAAFADAVVRGTHAWCLRAHLAIPGTDDPESAVARTQISSISVKFLLEQAAFARSSLGEWGLRSREPRRDTTPTSPGS